MFLYRQCTAVHSKVKGRSRRIRKGVRISACPAIRLLRRAASTAARAVPSRIVQLPFEPSSGFRANHGSEETSRRTSERGDAKPHKRALEIYSCVHTHTQL